MIVSRTKAQRKTLWQLVHPVRHKPSIPRLRKNLMMRVFFIFTEKGDYKEVSLVNTPTKYIPFIDIRIEMPRHLRMTYTKQ
jgi:hypothetical protein